MRFVLIKQVRRTNIPDGWIVHVRAHLAAREHFEEGEGERIAHRVEIHVRHQRVEGLIPEPHRSKALPKQCQHLLRVVSQV